MDRSWINSRLFSKAHQDGVYGYKGIVEDHLYIHGMCSTYDRWIYHGEPFDAGIDDRAGHLDKPIGFNEDVGIMRRKKTLIITGSMKW